MRAIRRLAHSTALLTVAAVVVLSAASAVLDFPVASPAQEHSQWCWAGSGQAILAYYGQAVSQCTIANYATGYPDTAGRPDCCTPSGYSADNNVISGCNYWNYLWGSSVWGVSNGSLQGILAHWGIASQVLGRSLTVGETLADIGGRRPAVMRFQWTNGSGHFLDIYGLEEDGTYLDYWDPLPGNGATRSLYTWVVNAPGHHSWTHTLRLTTGPPIDPPTFTDDPLAARATPVRTVHITELRQKIDALRARYALAAFAWTDPDLAAGTTPVRAVHIIDLRTALADVFTAAVRSQPGYSDETITPGVTVITTAHIAELRAAVTGIW